MTDAVPKAAHPPKAAASVVLQKVKVAPKADHLAVKDGQTVAQRVVLKVALREAHPAMVKVVPQRADVALAKHPQAWARCFNS